MRYSDWTEWCKLEAITKDEAWYCILSNSGSQIVENILLYSDEYFLSSQNQKHITAKYM